MKYLHLPVDIEVHRGLDGRVYIIDTARIFPPVTIDKRRRASHLYRLMRSGALAHSLTRAPLSVSTHLT